MQKKLSKLGEISSGYTFRGSIENDPDGGIFVLQARDITANQDILSSSDFTRVTLESKREPYFLQKNDILLVSRGSGFGSFKSTIFFGKEENIIPSSSVHIIRIKDVTVIPKYISLYFNSDTGQKALLQIVTGASYIQSILIKNLTEFEIPIPPIHTQKSIIDLHENIQAQEKILHRKNEIKQNIISATFTNLINK